MTVSGTKTAAVERIVPAGRDEWLAQCSACPSATFFHTPFWAELFSGGAPGRFVPEVNWLQCNDGTRVLLPLMRKKHLFGLVSIMISMPAVTYGGWLSTHPLTEAHRRALLQYLYRFPDCIVRENPLDPFPFTENDHVLDENTRMVDLSGGYDAAWQRASHAHRKAVRNARRKGLVCCEGDDDDQWNRYFDLYTDSIGRWKRRRIFSGVAFDRTFLMAVKRLDPSLRKLWLVSLDGKYIAGIICFYWNRHVVAWHGAGLAEYFEYRPNNLLYDHAIEHAAREGFAWFDCNPSSGLAGVSTFKKLIGAEPVRSSVLIRRSPLCRLADTVRLRRARR